MNFCVIIPTYNNSGTLAKVLDDVLRVAQNVIVVNDGSDDGTTEILESFGERITVVSYSKNRGKGYALAKGFKTARKMGFEAAITIDSDGQHKASDIAALLEKYSENEGSMVIGARKFDAPNMPSKNTFANRFSNFWFAVQTARKLPDTQTGFRLYPLKKMGKMSPLNNRYEAELELLVRSAWRNIRLISCEIDVYYPPKEERVSHFRPTWDFVRISILNTVLCILAVIYGYPSMGIRKLINSVKA